MLETEILISLGISAHHWRTGYISGRDQVGAFDARLPIGLDLEFAKSWDAFLEAIPALEVNRYIYFEFDAAIGIRYHFPTK